MAGRGLSRLAFCSAPAERRRAVDGKHVYLRHRREDTATSLARGPFDAVVKKQQLEILLQRVKGHPKPVAGLEQYSTPATIAAGVLWFAYGGGGIAGEKGVDLGCGAGVLGVGAKLLRAGGVVSLDVGEAGLRVAM